MPQSFTDIIKDSIPGASQNVLNTGMGLLLANYNDKRQLRQQQKLTDIQLNANKEMSAYNYDQQYNMWLKTNYPAQVDQLKQAGLNPALLYGGGGSGGSTTTGSGSGGGGIAGAMAPAGGGEILALQNMQANIDLTKALTAKANAEAKKTGGVDTDVANATLGQIAATITNTNSQTALNNINTELLKIDKDFRAVKDKLTNDVLNTTSDKIQQEIFILKNDVQISDETKQAIIQKINAEGVGAILNNELTRANINLNEQNIQTQIETIKQNWYKLSIQEKQLQLNKLINEADINLKTTTGQYLDKMTKVALTNTIISGAGTLLDGVKLLMK